MPYLVMRRTDIPAGSLQALDLRPNVSNKNSVLEPGLGETRYLIPRPVVETVATSGAGPIVTVAAYHGLSAYLIDHVANAAAGQALTATQANTAAAAIRAKPGTGLVVTLASINAAIVAAGAAGGTSLIAGGSTGSVQDVLQILAGREYLLPTASQVEDAGNLFDATVRGSFTTPSRHINLTGDLLISIGEGNLFRMMESTFNYLNVAGAAVVVYDDTGAVMV